MALRSLSEGVTCGSKSFPSSINEKRELTLPGEPLNRLSPAPSMAVWYLIKGHMSAAYNYVKRMGKAYVDDKVVDRAI